MHELGHVLGFNAQSLAHFRDPDTGRPLTPRDGRGDVPDILVECTGPAPRLTTSLVSGRTTGKSDRSNRETCTRDVWGVSSDASLVEVYGLPGSAEST